MSFKEIEMKDLKIAPCELFGTNWALIGAGNKDNKNIMTASWGMVGKLWHKDVAVAFIRPQRHTYKIVEDSDYFTLSFLPEEYREALKICGATSGRDYDKFDHANLTPYYVDETTAVDESEIVFVCKKIAITDFDPKDFLDEEVDAKFYPDKDYHRAYVGEIVKVLVK